MTAAGFCSRDPQAGTQEVRFRHDMRGISLAEMYHINHTLHQNTISLP